MIPEIGQLALVLALIVALIQCTFPFLGVSRGIQPWMQLAKSTAKGQFLLIGIAFGCLAYLFITNDFTVLNVASHSHSKLPIPYRFAATWGSHEGSLLLWVFLLSGWVLAVAQFNRHLPLEMLARVLGVMGAISTGFLSFLLLTSNPFERLLPGAMEGQDLNPLLQDPAMVIHPPMLYMGYVGFSVAFAFAIAALLAGKLDSVWARWSRSWTLLAWMFLTIGIILGSRWAYYELGWGGWWFWDPVENASFIPWLAGTALIHSLMVTEKRNAFTSWTVLLAISAFSFSLLGTFLVRSGVLTSVHAFATDPKRGVFILIFLLFVIGGSLLLFALRAPHIKGEGKFALPSRETFLLFNNLLLIVAALTVLLGTLYPLFMEVLGLGKISVGPPYFNKVFVPLMAPVIFLMGIGPLVQWKQAHLPHLTSRLHFPLIGSILVAIILPLFLGEWSFLKSLGIGLATWAILTTLLKTLDKTRGFYCTALAHIGVAVCVLGITFAEGYKIEQEVKLGVEEKVKVGHYDFKLNGIKEIAGPNYLTVRGDISFQKNGKMGGTLYPEKRFYPTRETWLTEAAIDSTPFRDLYVALGDPLEKNIWSVRIHYKPLVNWIWGGGLLMVLGGLLATSDRRYRS